MKDGVVAVHGRIIPKCITPIFERELEGCIRGSKVPPEKLKEIWGISHAHG